VVTVNWDETRDRELSVVRLEDNSFCVCAWFLKVPLRHDLGMFWRSSLIPLFLSSCTNITISSSRNTYDHHHGRINDNMR
jgi:hypothetical protein